MFGKKNLPQSNNRRFFPKIENIRAHMVRAKQKLRYVIKIIKKYIFKILTFKEKKSRLVAFSIGVYFVYSISHRYSMIDQECLEKKIEEWKTADPTLNVFFRSKKDTCDEKKNFLFVHQKKWQRDLLQRYGNEILLLDATYKNDTLCTSAVFSCCPYES